MKNLLLANDTRGSVPGEHWGSWLTTTQLSALLERAGLRVTDTLPLGRLQPEQSIWERIEKAGGLVINGEGSVHSGKASAAALLGALQMARERGIPVWIVNHACFQCDSLMHLYRYADFIAVRDIASHGYLAQHGIASRLAADCSFLTSPGESPRRDRLLVCCGLQPPPAREVERWAAGLNCSEVVLSNDFYPRFPSGEALKSRSAAECFQLFASAKFVISSSFHGCIFATIHSVPFLPVQVAGQPPKTLVAAVEAMGPHAHRVLEDGPRYVNQRWDEVRLTMQKRAAWFRKRAAFNLPAGNA